MLVMEFLLIKMERYSYGIPILQKYIHNKKWPRVFKETLNWETKASEEFHIKSNLEISCRSIDFITTHNSRM